MEINIKAKAESSWQLFNLTYERADEILHNHTRVCANAIHNFNDSYKLSVVVDQGNNSSRLMYRLDTSKMLIEMLEIANTEDEKNFALYTAYTGIEQTMRIVESIYVL